MAFFKPAGVLTTMSDPLERPNISDYTKDVPVRVFPIGRLDYDSEGLILLTNDGDFAQKITHPKNEVTKTYIVKLRRDPAPTQIQRLLRGVTIRDGKVAAKSLEKINRGKDDHPWYKIVITEGKNHQIRQMFEKINNDVLKLQRVAIGRLRIGALKRGQLVYLNEAILDKIFLPDLPDEVKEMKSYKGKKQESTKVATKENTKRHFRQLSIKEKQKEK
jgi:23S rRNA pseudouridine2605 synthase